MGRFVSINKHLFFSPSLSSLKEMFCFGIESTISTYSNFLLFVTSFR
jgi:hypothetical protein